MTLNFTKSELSKIMAFLGPYITPKTPTISIRILKGGMLELFASAGMADGGSALVRVPCNKSASIPTWKYVDGPTLQGVISNADEGAIALDFGETAVTIKTSPRSTHELIYVLAERNEVKFTEPSATLKGKDLNLIAMMTEAASTDEARPGLTGIYLAARKNEIEAAAADGYMLSFTSIQAQDIESPGTVYSVKALNRAKRAIKASNDEEVKVGFALEGKGIVPGLVLSVERDGTQVLLHVPKMDGMFPDYKTITKNAPKGIQVEIETSIMEKWLKRANAVEGNVFFQALNGFLWFMARNEDEGQSVDSLAINVKDESVVMHYAASLLKDTLKACAANGKIKLTFPAASNSPMLFDGEASVIAMPLVSDLKESPFKNLQPALI